MEKRNFTRVEFKTDASVTSSDKTIEGAVENLSLNGMLLKTSDRVPVDEEVDIRILISGPNSTLWLRVLGKVQRHDQDGLGILFTQIGIDSFFHLRNIVGAGVGKENEKA